jgi:hypothetical protein
MAAKLGQIVKAREDALVQTAREESGRDRIVTRR